MTAEELAADLRRRGAVLRVNGEKLKVKAPKELLTEAVLAALKANKPAILALLAAEQLALRGLVRCARCRRILAERHVREQPDGWRCLDYVDCTASKLIADAAERRDE